jgi:maltooligosyltrehalose trehalohydrolase
VIVQLSVWAPERARVELEIDGRRHALERDGRGWWRGASGLARPGLDYAFALDGGRALPDPRAPWLPHGVHGPARVLDHGAFRWSDAHWRPPLLARAVFYELHVGTFAPEGTFDGVRARLDHLAELGVTHVELMPVGSFPGQHGWGYDGVGLYAPHEPYGGPEALKRLVDACHRAGLAVVLDVVYNHLGPEGNVLAEFGPYFTDAYRTPWGPALNLDGAGSDEVRAFLVDNALQWLRDYHFDGLRLDAVHGLFDRSAVHFLEELAGATRALEVELGRALLLVAESDLNDPRLVRPPALGGYGLDAQWSDDFHHALHAVLTGERAGYYADFGRLADVAKACERVFVLDGGRSRHRRRRHGRPVGDLPGWRFLGYLQDHDQVGNRARGERIVALAGERRARVGAALVFAAPFVPLVFQGEEWASSSPFPFFADHADPALRAAVREGRRREFAEFHASGELPDPEARATFESARLRWDERERDPHRAMLAWYRALVRLRGGHPGWTNGALADVRVAFDEERRWLRLARGPLVCVANFGPDAAQVPLDDDVARALVLASDERCELADCVVHLPGESAAFLEPALG